MTPFSRLLLRDRTTAITRLQARAMSQGNEGAAAPAPPSAGEGTTSTMPNVSAHEVTVLMQGVLGALAAMEKRLSAPQPAPDSEGTDFRSAQSPSREDRSKKTPIYPLPDVYDGSKEKCRHFITQAKQYYEFYEGTAKDEDLVRILASRLTAAAETWRDAKIEAQRHKNGDSTDGIGKHLVVWQRPADFLDELEATFANPTEKIDAYNEYTSIRLVDYPSWPECLSAIRQAWAILPTMSEAYKFHGIVACLPESQPGQPSAIKINLANDSRWIKWLKTPYALEPKDVEKFIERVGQVVSSCGYVPSATRHTKTGRSMALTHARTSGMSDSEARLALELHFINDINELTREQKRELYAKKLCYCCRGKIPEECAGFRQCKHRTRGTPTQRKAALTMAALGQDRADQGFSEEAVLAQLFRLDNDPPCERDMDSEADPFEFTGDLAKAALMVLQREA